MFAAVKRYSREIDSGPGKADGPERQRTDWSGRECLRGRVPPVVPTVD